MTREQQGTTTATPTADQQQHQHERGQQIGKDEDEKGPAAPAARSPVQRNIFHEWRRQRTYGFPPMRQRKVQDAVWALNKGKGSTEHGHVFDHYELIHTFPTEERAEPLQQLIDEHLGQAHAIQQETTIDRVKSTRSLKGVSETLYFAGYHKALVDGLLKLKSGRFHFLENNLEFGCTLLQTILEACPPAFFDIDHRKVMSELLMLSLVSPAAFRDCWDLFQEMASLQLSPMPLPEPVVLKATLSKLEEGNLLYPLLLCPILSAYCGGYNEMEIYTPGNENFGTRHFLRQRLGPGLYPRAISREYANNERIAEANTDLLLSCIPFLLKVVLRLGATPGGIFYHRVALEDILDMLMTQKLHMHFVDLADGQIFDGSLSEIVEFGQTVEDNYNHYSIQPMFDDDDDELVEALQDFARNEGRHIDADDEDEDEDEDGNGDHSRTEEAGDSRPTERSQHSRNNNDANEGGSFDETNHPSADAQRGEVDNDDDYDDDEDNDDDGGGEEGNARDEPTHLRSTFHIRHDPLEYPEFDFPGIRHDACEQANMAQASFNPEAEVPILSRAARQPVGSATSTPARDSANQRRATSPRPTPTSSSNGIRDAAPPQQHHQQQQHRHPQRGDDGAVATRAAAAAARRTARHQFISHQHYSFNGGVLNDNPATTMFVYQPNDYLVDDVQMFNIFDAYGNDDEEGSEGDGADFHRLRNGNSSDDGDTDSSDIGSDDDEPLISGRFLRRRGHLGTHRSGNYQDRGHGRIYHRRPDGTAFESDTDSWSSGDDEEGHTFFFGPGEYNSDDPQLFEYDLDDIFVSHSTSSSDSEDTLPDNDSARATEGNPEDSAARHETGDGHRSMEPAPAQESTQMHASHGGKADGSDDDEDNDATDESDSPLDFYRSDEEVARLLSFIMGEGSFQVDDRDPGSIDDMVIVTDDEFTDEDDEVDGSDNDYNEGSGEGSDEGGDEGGDHDREESAPADEAVRSHSAPNQATRGDHTPPKASQGVVTSPQSQSQSQLQTRFDDGQNASSASLLATTPTSRTRSAPRLTPFVRNMSRRRSEREVRGSIVTPLSEHVEDGSPLATRREEYNASEAEEDDINRRYLSTSTITEPTSDETGRAKGKNVNTRSAKKKDSSKRKKRRAKKRRKSATKAKSDDVNSSPDEGGSSQPKIEIIAEGYEGDEDAPSDPTEQLASVPPQEAQQAERAMFVEAGEDDQQIMIGGIPILFDGFNYYVIEGGDEHLSGKPERGRRHGHRQGTGVDDESDDDHDHDADLSSGDLSREQHQSLRGVGRRRRRRRRRRDEQAGNIELHESESGFTADEERLGDNTQSHNRAPDAEGSRAGGNSNRGSNSESDDDEDGDSVDDDDDIHFILAESDDESADEGENQEISAGTEPNSQQRDGQRLQANLRHQQMVERMQFLHTHHFDADVLRQMTSELEANIGEILKSSSPRSAQQPPAEPEKRSASPAFGKKRAHSLAHTASDGADAGEPETKRPLRVSREKGEFLLPMSSNSKNNLKEEERVPQSSSLSSTVASLEASTASLEAKTSRPTPPTPAQQNQHNQERQELRSQMNQRHVPPSPESAPPLRSTCPTPAQPHPRTFSKLQLPPVPPTSQAASVRYPEAEDDDGLDAKRAKMVSRASSLHSTGKTNFASGDHDAKASDGNNNTNNNTNNNNTNNNSTNNSSQFDAEATDMLKSPNGERGPHIPGDGVGGNTPKEMSPSQDRVPADHATPKEIASIPTLSFRNVADHEALWMDVEKHCKRHLPFIRARTDFLLFHAYGPPNRFLPLFETVFQVPIHSAVCHNQTSNFQTLLLSLIAMPVFRFLRHLTSGAHARRAKLLLAACDLVPSLEVVCRLIPWGRSMNHFPATDYPRVHRPDCECNVDIAVKNEFIRLVQKLILPTTFSDHVDLRPLFYNKAETDLLAKMEDALSLPQRSSMLSPHVTKHRSRKKKGFAFSLIEAFLKEPINSSPKWQLSSVLGYLFLHASFAEQLVLHTTCIVEYCVDVIMNKYDPYNYGLRIFTLLGSIIHCSPHAILRLDFILRRRNILSDFVQRMTKHMANADDFFTITLLTLSLIRQDILEASPATVSRTKPGRGSSEVRKAKEAQEGKLHDAARSENNAAAAATLSSQLPASATPTASAYLQRSRVLAPPLHLIPMETKRAAFNSRFSEFFRKHKNWIVAISDLLRARGFQSRGPNLVLVLLECHTLGTLPQTLKVLKQMHDGQVLLRRLRGIVADYTEVYIYGKSENKFRQEYWTCYSIKTISSFANLLLSTSRASTSILTYIDDM